MTHTSLKVDRKSQAINMQQFSIKVAQNTISSDKLRPGCKTMLLKWLRGASDVIDLDGRCLTDAAAHGIEMTLAACCCCCSQPKPRTAQMAKLCDGQAVHCCAHLGHLTTTDSEIDS